MYRTIFNISLNEYINNHYVCVVVGKGKLFLFCEARAKLNVLERVAGFSELVSAFS